MSFLAVCSGRSARSAGGAFGAAEFDFALRARGDDHRLPAGGQGDGWGGGVGGVGRGGGGEGGGGGVLWGRKQNTRFLLVR